MEFDLAAFLGFLGLALLPALGISTFLLASEVRHGRVEFRSRTAACLHWVAVALACIPALSLAGLALLVATAWLDRGELPSPVRMDPHRFLEFIGGPPASVYDPVHLGLTGLWVASMLGILVAPGLFVLASAIGRPIGRRPVVAYSLTWAGMIVLIVVDPGSLVSWAFND